MLTKNGKKKKKCGKDGGNMKSWLFLQLWSRRVEQVEGGDSRCKIRIRIKQPETIFVFGLSLLLIPKGTSLFPVHFVPVDGFFQIHLFCHFLSQTWLTIRHSTAAFSTRYTFVVFKYGTPHIKKIYAHQASIFRALEGKGTHLPALPVLPAILFHKIKTRCVCMTKIRIVQNSGYKLIYLMYL